ncbi:hypothetical protein CHARACLAT_005373 [Characodon lateralis]|uniref:Uncharacterized protein n=1 Tax=Characodon lateralis TaxID=208331 RepID=A0ABU7CNW5_9TELE|nr:hypothetical protein [Characodon lateralis]
MLYLQKSSQTFCCALRCVIIQPLCYEFFIASQNIAPLLASTTAYLNFCTVSIYLLLNTFIVCRVVTALPAISVRAKRQPVAICKSNISADRRGRSHEQGNDREGGVG